MTVLHSESAICRLLLRQQSQPFTLLKKKQFYTVVFNINNNMQPTIHVLYYKRNQTL